MTSMAQQPIAENVSEEAMNSAENTSRSGSGATDRIKFEDCNISFAIDTSGSTLGKILAVEQQAILDVCSKLTPRARDTAKILPWNSVAESVTTLSELGDLESYGGTEPVSLLDNLHSRKALQSSTMWFLLTDGEIFEWGIQGFAKSLAMHAMHGTACVVAVFGPVFAKPAECNISVGVAVFAAVPDCLFLYFDTSASTIYLLQCSGRFTQILEKHKRNQPVLTEETSWNDLPQISVGDLSDVSIPVPKALGKDELALPDGLVLNLEDLWAGRLNDERTIDRIFGDDDNLKSIMLTAQTRGRVKSFQEWLKPFLDDTSSPLMAHEDLGGKAIQSVRAILEEMQAGAPKERLKVLQEELSAARTRNVSCSLGVQTSTSSNTTQLRKSSASTAMSRSERSYDRGRSLSSISAGIDNMDMGYIEPAPSVGSRPLLNPGFQCPESSKGSFEGTCSLCASSKAMLVFLLRKPPSKLKTRGFPAPNSKTRLTYPLAMGNFPETDIISSSVCCDSCSYYLAQYGKTPQQEELSCVLPLVTYAVNEEAYKKQLSLALDERFHEDDLPQLLLAILMKTLERLSDNKNHDLFRNMIKWACADLLLNVHCSASLLPTPPASPPPVARNTLKGVILKHFEAVYQDTRESAFWYPLQGFITMTLALKYSDVSPKLPRGLNNVVWQRFLYHVTQEYHGYLEAQGPVLAHIMMTQIILEAAEGIPSDKIRKASLKSLRDLARTLFGDRKVPNAKVLIDLDVLTSSKLLTPTDLTAYKSLGDTFKWIQAKTGNALCVFLNHLARTERNYDSAWSRFSTLKKKPELAKVFLDPSDISPKMVEELIGGLAPMVETN